MDAAGAASGCAVGVLGACEGTGYFGLFWHLLSFGRESFTARSSSCEEATTKLELA